MAIVFDCPHCKTNYRLKDDLEGKTATCKNPGCRKVLTIPAPSAPAKNGAAVLDIDALAAAAFSDEPVAAAAVAEEMIPVTCAGCDHAWQVEASKEGKNVLCPECRKPNRVPLRKKAEKVDWRTDGNRPTMAKRETGDTDAIKNVVTGIGTETARAIVKSREAEEEPEEKRKKWIKRGLYGTLLAAVLGGGLYFALKSRKESRTDSKMEDAVAEVKAEEKPDPRHLALIHRASGEYHLRAAANTEERDTARTELVLARNTGTRGVPGAKAGVPTIEKDGIAAEIALTLVEMAGTTEEIAAGRRYERKDFAPEIRQTIGAIGDADLAAETMRGVTRRLAAKDMAAVAEEIARASNNPAEMVGQVGIELLRIDKAKHEGLVQKLLNSLPPGTESPAIATLRLYFANPNKKEEGKSGPPPAIAVAEVAALKGDIAGAKAGVEKVAVVPERIKARLSVASTIIATDPTGAVTLLNPAIVELKDSKGSVSPWLGVRLAGMLARADRQDLADQVVPHQPDLFSQAWAKLAILRGRMAAGGAKAKPDSNWYEPVGDPVKFAAAALACEEVARHNARHGHAYQEIVKLWPKGSQRPFGTAGIILGQQDPKDYVPR